MLAASVCSSNKVLSKSNLKQINVDYNHRHMFPQASNKSFLELTSVIIF